MLVAKTGKRHSNGAEKHHGRQQADDNLRAVHDMGTTPKRQVAKGTGNGVHNRKQHKKNQDRRLVRRRKANACRFDGRIDAPIAATAPQQQKSRQKTRRQKRRQRSLNNGRRHGYQ